MPNPTNGTGLIVSTTASFPLGNVGSYVPASGPTPGDQRIFFRIKDFTKENLYYGFNWEVLSPSGSPITSPYSDVFMNIFDPTGVLVTTINLPTGSGAGFITTYANAMAGPDIGGATPGGYSPLTFTPTRNGDYYVSFYRSPDGGITHISGGESMLSKYFDLTVAKTDNTQYTGRVHCNEWAFSVYNPNANDIQDPKISSNAQFFAYTVDSVVTKVYFPASGGFQPLSYILSVTGFGVQNNGNWLVDRQSINLKNLIPPYLTRGFNVFLNAPDPSLYPACVIPSPPILVSPTISGCPPGPFNVRFSAPQAGDFYMLFDLNGIPGYQANSPDRYIELINQLPGIITYVWDGKDGTGVSVPANTTFPITFSFRKGRINIPLYDDELNINGFSVDGVAPIGSLNTTLYWDDSKLSSMGTDCSSNNNNFTGIGYSNTIMGQASPGHAWNGNGNSGQVIPAPSVSYSGTANDQDNIQCNDFGNARLINTWAWGIVLNTTQNLTLTCLNVSGTVWDDADNSAAGTLANIRTNSEPGTNAGNGLYASLIDPVTGTVLSSVAVASNGTYSLPNCPVNATGMKVVISTIAGTVGSAAPAAAVPSGWITTSPLIYIFNTGSTNMTGLDFGIERLPDSQNQYYTILTPILNSYRTLNGTGSAGSPGPLIGSDPEDGALGSGKKVVITQVPTNVQLYYNGTLVTNNTTIANYNVAQLQVKFTTITITSLSFQYAFFDAGNQQDPSPATYTINLSSVLQTTIVSFSAKATDAGNVLNWKATEETNGAYFVIERSADGMNFQPIGRVDGAGNGATMSHSFTDNSPLPGTANFYRLRLTDPNEGTFYSTIVTIAAFAGRSEADVSPNPFQDGLNIKVNLAKSGRVVIRLLDSKGMLLRGQEYEAAKGTNNFSLNGLSSFPVSVYFVQIVLPDQVIVKKVFNQL
ncbi:T9SS type A sorting domain-containing protein [Flavitalea flava]